MSGLPVFFFYFKPPTGGPPFSKSGYDLTPLTSDEVGSMVDKLTELQKVVLTQASNTTESRYLGEGDNGCRAEYIAAQSHGTVQAQRRIAASADKHPPPHPSPGFLTRESSAREPRARGARSWVPRRPYSVLRCRCCGWFCPCRFEARRDCRAASIPYMVWCRFVVVWCCFVVEITVS